MVKLRGKFRDVQGLHGCQLPENYEDVQWLDEGGQAVVYTARLGLKKVAIKRYKRPFDNVKTAENAYRELILMKSIDYPYFLTLDDVFTPAEKLADFNDFYMVANLSGKTLEALLQRPKPIGPFATRSIIKQILDALAYLHEHDIIHRDLHPKNILADGSLNVKLIDFGLSTEDKSGLTNVKDLTSYVIAKHYRAPEVIREEKYTKSVDVWAAGCILYELFERKPLFEGVKEEHVKKQQEELFGDENRAKATVTKLLSYNSFRILSVEPSHVTDDMGKKKIIATTLKPIRDLFFRMMAFDPTNRIRAVDAYTHPVIDGQPTSNYSVPQKLSYTLGDATVEHEDEWKKLLFDHLKSGTKVASVWWDLQNHPSPPTSAWIPSFQSKCQADPNFSDEHALSYTRCAFRPFNEEKLVVRVLLADYRKAVKDINHATYDEFSPEVRHYIYVNHIYWTDLDYEKRYEKYAADIRQLQLMKENLGLPLLIIDDSDLREWEWLHGNRKVEVLNQRAHEFGIRLNAFIEALEHLGVDDYELHFSLMSFYPCVGCKNCVASLKDLIRVFKHTVVNLPPLLTFAVIADVKSACENYATIAHSASECKRRQTACTVIICQKAALKASLEAKEGRSIASENDLGTSTTRYFTLHPTKEIDNNDKAVEKASGTNETRKIKRETISNTETKNAALCIRSSSNSRRLWIFYRDGSLLAFDRNDDSHKIFRPKSRKCENVADFVVVNSTTIIVLEWNYLVLVRLYPADEQYDAVVLERSGAFAYIFTEITGNDVDVPQLVLNQDYAEELRFTRLDLDEPECRLVWSYHGGPELTRSFYHFGKSGLLYGIRRNSPSVLFTFYLSKKMGKATETMPRDVPSFSTRYSFHKSKKQDFDSKVRIDRERGIRAFWSPTHVYSYGFEIVEGALQYSIHRCHLEKPQWERIGFVKAPILHFSAEVNAETGEDDKLLVITMKDGDEPELLELQLPSSSRAQTAADSRAYSNLTPDNSELGSSSMITDYLSDEREGYASSLESTRAEYEPVMLEAAIVMSNIKKEVERKVLNASDFKVVNLHRKPTTYEELGLENDIKITNIKREIMEFEREIIAKFSMKSMQKETEQRSLGLCQNIGRTLLRLFSCGRSS